MEQLKEYIVMLLSDIIRRRERENIQPYHAEMVEIQNMLVADAKACINTLFKEHVLSYHKTLNDIAFEFTPPKR